MTKRTKPTADDAYLARWAAELVAACPRPEVEGLLRSYESRAQGRLAKELRTEAASRAHALRVALEQSSK